ncbi:Protein suppressor of white apricot [Gryllus bimaculatus]|nr:Protein suppressor of white apricot [Gryllus bimaculatus]
MASTRQPWQCSDSGILRKKENDEEELLVFGYSCKLFRDDEKALYIDQGKHLIPWMGDEALKIDRYDGRGALYDLKQCEPLPGGHDENWWVGLSEAERHVEQLCDEERYRALNHNEEEEALYQEEELKRLHQALGNNAYGQVAFDYDEANGKPEEKGDGEVMSTEDPEEDEIFVAPTELDIPVGMILPDTVKLNAIIEKTALFISKQGPQMEILLKMKQANNPQFLFLSYDAPLHPYYRHLLGAIKAGRYQPLASSQPKEESQEDNGDEHYLHPSLAATGSRVELAPSIPSINYKPSTDCAYSMLVNRIKDKQAAFGLIPAPKTEEQPVPSVSSTSGLAISTLASTVPALVPVPQYYMADPVISAAPVRYNIKPEKVETDPETSSVQAAAAPAPPVVAPASAPVHVVSRGRGGSLKETSRRSVASTPSTRNESGPRSDSPNVSTPPQDMQIIIDKMASYVAKNGQDFETIVRSKGDPRFAFLEPTHSYNSYYRHKISVYLNIENEGKEKQVGVVKDEQAEVSEASQGIDTAGEESQDGTSLHSPSSEREEYDGEENGRRGKPAPVCFSIKKPKDTEHGLLEKRSALPVEESSDEEGAQEGEKTNKTESKVDKPPVQTTDVVKESVVVTPVKEEAELIDLTDDNAITQPEKRSGTVEKTRWAEERLKDKLAAAAREKLAAAAREKQLQAERKRRAAAFLNMIGREHPVNKSQPTLIGPQLPDGAPVQSIQESPKLEVDSDVSTIPSPTSDEVPSPPHIGRIQASNPNLRKLRDGGYSGCDQSSRSAMDSRSNSHKRKHSFEHDSNSPRTQTKGDDDNNHRHKKSKKKDHSRSRSHSRSHSSQSHSHHQSFRTSNSDWEQHRHKKKKKKKKSHHRSSSESP